MLVLSRKLGEKIVLPELDVTVTVLRISSNRVRVGIAAPLEISVRRDELKDRIDERKVPPPNTNETVAGALASAPLAPDLDAMLAHSITHRTAGQIESLHVETSKDCFIIHGRARSYYARQLVQAAVMETLKASSSCRPQVVVYDIEMDTDRRPTELTCR